MDFMPDKIPGGRKFKTFNVIDIFTREVLAIHVATSIPDSIVAQVLERIGDRRRFSDLIICDNGPEFTGNTQANGACPQYPIEPYHLRGKRLRIATSKVSMGGFEMNALI